MTGDDDLRSGLGLGEVDDDAFDALYPAPIRAKSGLFWTPVEVARRAASLFASQDARRVLDVGSGPGKLCLVAACACPEIELTGIEQRPHLVDAARAAAQRLGVDNVRFLLGEATDLRWDGFDGIYLYNPFAENLYGDEDVQDAAVELSVGRYLQGLRWVAAALADARVGTSVVTYNGFGGPIPGAYDLVHEGRAGCDWLRLWVKRRPATDGDVHYREGLEGVSLVGAVG